MVMIFFESRAIIKYEDIIQKFNCRKAVLL